jgi:plasmid stabilization system protein ParE
MRYKIRIRPQAERDTRRAFSWYEKQRPGLGRELALELDAIYDRLAENPHIYADIYRGIHRAITRRFPYGIFYLIVESEVRILSVTDMSRNPSVWKRRNDN